MLRKGEETAGTILIVVLEKGANARVFERMPDAEGHRKWTCSKVQSADNSDEIYQYLNRRAAQDEDLWIVELDIANGERFIGLT